MRGQWLNHLQSIHYHLGLICVHCQDYFTSSAEAMHQHPHLHKTMTGSDDDEDSEERDYENNDNGNEDDKFMFEEN